MIVSMQRGIATLVFAVAALTCNVATAQFKLGQTAKEFAFHEIWNDAPKDFAGFRGKVVVLCMMHSKVDQCRETVPRLNELHKKYGKRGLLVVGVSNEASNTTKDEFLKGLEVSFPWIKANKVVKQYRVKFWPTAYCLDSFGVVQAVPDTGVPLDIEIEELLLTIPKGPAIPKSNSYKKLRTLWQARDYAGLSAYLDKNLQNPDLKEADGKVMKEQKAALTELQELVSARIDTLSTGPDYGASAGQLERIVASWQGLEPATAAQAHLTRFAADEKIAHEIVAWGAMTSLAKGVNTSKPARLRKYLKNLGAFTKDPRYAATHAAKLAMTEWNRLGMR
ncbi:MAG: peroxiredoxin [Planctomycetota bacterium]|jgi:peroxiredoxin